MVVTIFQNDCSLTRNKTFLHVYFKRTRRVTLGTIGLKLRSGCSLNRLTIIYRVLVDNLLSCDKYSVQYTLQVLFTV